MFFFFFTRVVLWQITPLDYPVLMCYWPNLGTAQLHTLTEINLNANINVHLIKYKFTNLSQERKLLVTIGQVFIGPNSAISWRVSGKNAYTNPSPCPGSTCSSKAFTSRDVYTTYWWVNTPSNLCFAVSPKDGDTESLCPITGRLHRHLSCSRSHADCFFFFLSDSLTIVNCHVISRCTSELLHGKSISVCQALVNAWPRRSSLCPRVRTKPAFNVSPTLTKSRAWLCFGRTSVLSADLRYLFAIKTKKGPANGKGFINGPGSCRGEDRRGPWEYWLARRRCVFVWR